MKPAETVGILMACHGDQEVSGRCGEALRGYMPKNVGAHLYITDDQCPNKSAEATKAGWGKETTIIATESPQFWARSMAIAEKAARRRNHGFLLWVNQDTVVTEPLGPLLDENRIVAGTCLIDGKPSKGALAEDGSKCRFRLTKAGELGITFNGNLVAIPKKIYKWRSIQGYRHAFADIAYGLRAHREGHAIIRGPVCAVTARQENNWRDEPNIWERARACISPRGLPPEDWWSFCREFGGRAWLLKFVIAYRYILKKRCLPKPMVKPEN